MKDAAEWLARVQHDLVKRLLWPARDRRDLGGTPAPHELLPAWHDDEGRPTTAQELWKGLCETAPPGLPVAAFADALVLALQAAASGDTAGVLALQTAFDNLARSMKG